MINNFDGRKYRRCIVFGGAGFIGSHFVDYALSSGLLDYIYLADMKVPSLELLSKFQGRLEYGILDVRTDPAGWECPADIDLIVNLAAVHREPGHHNDEYYETNLLGASNICKYAEQIICNNILFTSSIAPYGPGDYRRDESSLTTPTTAYGGSKLVSEKIHQIWQARSAARKLVIVRPGVVFGPGEGGNVSRLVRAVLRRYFLYMGNRSTVKAGGYVKELVRTMFWALGRAEDMPGNVFLYNFSMPKPPSVEDYVKTVCEVAEVTRRIPSLPFFVLLYTSYLIEGIARIFRIAQPINPTRVWKMVRSNNIEPTVLINLGYKYEFTLHSAMKDWRTTKPEDWS